MTALVKWSNLFLVIVTLLAYLAPYAHPDYFWPLQFLGVSYPWLLLGNLLFIVYWLFRKRAYFLYSLGCLLLGWGHFANTVGLSSHSQVPEGQGIHIMTYNIYSLKSLNEGSNATEYTRAFQAFLKHQKPDIFCTQETIRANSDFLSTYYPYQHRKGLTAVHSKYPIVQKGGKKFKRSRNGFVWVDVRMEADTFRIYSAHLQSNRVSDDTNRALAEGNIQTRKTWLSIRGILAKVKYATQKRATQALILAKHMQNSPHPVILCGDFNDVPLSYTYHLLSQGLQDSFRQRGQGLGTTYAGPIPNLRIDYILLSAELCVHTHQIYRKPFSDHYAISSIISAKTIQ